MAILLRVELFLLVRGAALLENRLDDRLRVGQALGLAQPLAHEVPLVDDDDDALGGVVDVAGDMRILRGDALHAVDHQHGDIGAIDGAMRAQDAVLLDARPDAPTAANARGVDQDERLALVVDDRINGVARGAGDVADDDALLPDDGVHQRGLTDVGTAHDGEAWRAGQRLVGVLIYRRGQQRGDRVEQVASSRAGDGGERDRLAQPQRVELDGLLPPRRIVGLVRAEHDAACPSGAADRRPQHPPR